MQRPRLSRTRRAERTPARTMRQAGATDIPTVLPDKPAPSPSPKVDEDLPDDLRQMLEAAYT